MISSEQILFNLKRSILEYSLKTNNQYLVSCMACSSKTKFNTYSISSIRFESFNMHVTVKNRSYSRFDTVIRFLNELNNSITDLIPEKLFVRVIASLKALVILSKIIIAKITLKLFNF
jgi:hypothetical protein